MKPKLRKNQIDISFPKMKPSDSNTVVCITGAAGTSLEAGLDSGSGLDDSLDDISLKGSSSYF